MFVVCTGRLYALISIEMFAGNCFAALCILNSFSSQFTKHLRMQSLKLVIAWSMPFYITIIPWIICVFNTFISCFISFQLNLSRNVLFRASCVTLKQLTYKFNQPIKGSCTNVKQYPPFPEQHSSLNCPSFKIPIQYPKASCAGFNPHSYHKLDLLQNWLRSSFKHPFRWHIRPAATATLLSVQFASTQPRRRRASGLASQALPYLNSN